MNRAIKYYLFALLGIGTIVLGAHIMLLWLDGEPAPPLVWLIALLFCAAIVNECVMQLARNAYRPEDFT
jgi:hypothetical protein